MFKAFAKELQSLRPEKFDYPFYYSPKELALKASHELMDDLENKPLDHDFEKIGKMFGVLICEKDQVVGYLKAFSGVLQNSLKPKDFVPHLYDELLNREQIENEKDEINQLTQKITVLEKEDHSLIIKNLDDKIALIEKELIAFKSLLKEKKKKRKKIREQNKESQDFITLEKELIKESLSDKHELKLYSQEKLKKIELIQAQKDELTQELTSLKKERAQRSHQLHKVIYESYELLNIHGEKKELIHLFDGDFPPAGTADCALPKLLQYAYKNGYRPLGFAEFWWGAPHRAQIRKHKNFYHACTGKCKPIMEHMLLDIPMEENPITNFSSKNLDFEIFYQDEDVILVDKPSGLLSVPGTVIKDSVYTRIKAAHPEYEGPIIIHRLDQDTSGIMILAKNESSYHHLQKQFMQRGIKKRYTALLDGTIEKVNGTIDLPLRLDLENRPMQLVDVDNGKKALTDYEVINVVKNKTLIHFYPKTGRTHQLRMHSAHHLGLNAPIIGDDFYGQKNSRLHLHASKIEFTHPRTNEKMVFEREIDFL